MNSESELASAVGVNVAKKIATSLKSMGAGRACVQSLCGRGLPLDLAAKVFEHDAQALHCYSSGETN